MPEPYAVAIVGAGAAGLASAIASARAKAPSVLLLDGREVIGAKILMSGGTRCNVTHVRVSPSDFFSQAPRTVRNILSGFPPERTLQFFRELGVSLVLEETGKYFPETNSAKTILEALMAETRRLGVSLLTGVKVERAEQAERLFHITSQDKTYSAQTLILCTGGLSYPSTGSDGSGYRLAEAFGHRRVETSPALTPLLTSDSLWKSLSGLTLDCRLECWVGGKKQTEFTDSFLFTHQGFSGPAALNISRHWIRAAKADAPEIRASFLPKMHENSLREKVLTDAAQFPTRSVKRWLAGLVPERLAEALAARAGIPEGMMMSSLTRTQREALIRAALQSSLEVSGTSGYAKAEVTAGGIDFADVDPHTLESRKVPGLFFAGEILDVDGRIGGFNFQWAWASGHAAGTQAAKKVLG
ncbi:MAG: NAD(P)/FAD-dependent oxidoreductase [Candidatus Omnitrophica bacterium]|nr:NAD(P)/FAD-dependent oxidoreductase [Candidatus Omnitrophota bacterium]